MKKLKADVGDSIQWIENGITYIEKVLEVNYINEIYTVNYNKQVPFNGVKLVIVNRHK